MIGIRADANETIAAGHIMRCITIAKQLIEKGESVLFFTADSHAASMLEPSDMEAVCLNTDWNDKNGELPVLLPKLKKWGCTKILVDSYQVTHEYLRELKTEHQVIYIDDMFEAVYSVDMVINYNAYHSRFPYRESYGRETKLLLGTSYVPLRKEFSGERGNKSQGGKREVLLSCGGGDIYHALSGILTKAVGMSELNDVIFHTVVGSFHPNASGLKELACQHENIRLHSNISNMAELMSRCDAAVSAAGTVLFELCAIQVPTVFFICADNQKYDSEFFAQESRMLFSGDIRADREACIQNICVQLTELLDNSSLQGKMKKKLHEVTDGNGASRIAQEILLL